MSCTFFVKNADISVALRDDLTFTFDDDLPCAFYKSPFTTLWELILADPGYTGSPSYPHGGGKYYQNETIK